MNNAFAGIKPEKREDLCGEDIYAWHIRVRIPLKELNSSGAKSNYHYNCLYAFYYRNNNDAFHRSILEKTETNQKLGIANQDKENTY
ncbi:5487_t:CDS:2 [Entrophospora sp. SA101]|nr:5487_t:CDS:2 [Entrophospora sp. SA101]